MKLNAAEVESRLIDFVAQDVHNPLAFVKSNYSWGEGDLTGSKGPRKWQAEVLDTIGKHLRNPLTRHTPLRIAVASAHGIGKSALVGQIAHWGLSTMPGTMVRVTAVKEDQLRTTTWPEICKWFGLGLNKHWWKVTATTIMPAEDRSLPKWRADAMTWSENNVVGFQGLHNYGRRIIMIFDEASGIADNVWTAAEGALTDENTEIIWICFGNPTENTGRFRECFGARKGHWITKNIDGRTVEGTNRDYYQELIDYYGEDHDYVRVRIKGEFPRTGSMQFIPSDTVDAARKREPEAKLYDPVVMGVDVARFGDDQTVICLRRGRDAKSIPWHVLRGADTMTVAARVMELAGIHRPDAIFIDGGGVGGGVIDRLRMLKLPVIEVQFGASADRSQMTESGPFTYANKRAEIWGYMRDWLKGAMIPDDSDLADQLTGVQYGYATRNGLDAILLEKKSDMKKRGLSSPDKADALALTFSYPVMASDHTPQFTGRSQHQIEYNPYSRQQLQNTFGTGNHQIEYNPFGRK